MVFIIQFEFMLLLSNFLFNIKKNKKKQENNKNFKKYDLNLVMHVSFKEKRRKEKLTGMLLSSCLHLLGKGNRSFLHH